MWCRWALIAGLMLAPLGCVSGERRAGQEGQIVQRHVGSGVLRHVVLFKFKAATTAEELTAIEKAFAALPDLIPAIENLEWGTDVSVEGLASGYTHCFVVTFKDEQARDAYLPHPAHAEFGRIAGPHIDKVLVIDYWTGD